MSFDRSVQESIEAGFTRDPQLSAFDIEVEVHNGLVSLRGRVPTARAKLAAQELAETTPGCSEVVNELAVVPARGVSDADMAEAVRHLLDQRSDITKGAITVRVDGGRVTLSGAVATTEEYAAAEEAARSIRGVRDVANLLIIDRDAQGDDQTLQREIAEAIAGVPDLREADINVAVSGDLIVLSGHVPEPRLREMAEEMAYTVRPWRLRNEIAVVMAG